MVEKCFTFSFNIMIVCTANCFWDEMEYVLEAVSRENTGLVLSLLCTGRLNIEYFQDPKSEENN